jgi:hypothetical protein
VLKQHTIGHAIDVRTAASICGGGVNANAEKIAVVLSEGGRKSGKLGLSAGFWKVHAMGARGRDPRAASFQHSFDSDSLMELSARAPATDP